MPARLGVNVDHVATIRQSRRTAYPDPVQAATFAELGGADQITIHLREDRRHVQERDLRILRSTVQTKLNLEMAATPAMVAIAREARPDVCTLVPERREELTTEGGLDVLAHREAVREAVSALQGAGIAVSLFVDPDVEQVKAARDVGAGVVELHTGRYCDARDAADRDRELLRIAVAARAASNLGLQVAAGHGLHYHNVAPVAAIAEIEEFNIGHAIVGHALLVGMERAVRDMKDAIARAR